MKVSLIVTVLDEENTIVQLLKSVNDQNLRPDEVTVVDGGSIDQTVSLVKRFSENHHQLKIKILTKKGNRSLGRNWAINNSKYDWIAITDAGCVLQKNWLMELVRAVESSVVKSSPDKRSSAKEKVEIVAGYYKGLAQTNFEQAVIPYVLVMPDRVDPQNFLPATRSMMIKKSVWKSLKGFDESLCHNEDYDFAIRIKQQGFKIKFTQKAIVNWRPSSNLKGFVKMVYRFAKGDMEANIIRPKVVLIFIRYFLFLAYSLLMFWGMRMALIWNGQLNSRNLFLFKIWLILIVLYISWSILKNIKYVRRGWYWLPVLQISSDLAVMWGSLRGWVRV